jgi:predicted ATPase
VRGLRALVAERGGAVIGLAPLTAAQVRQIAAAHVGPPGHMLCDELDRAGGNPFYVRELLEALSRENLIVRGRDGSAELVVGGGDVPDSLAATIGSRLRFLPEGTLRSLRSVALLGSEFSAEQWATVTGQTVTEVQVDVDHAAVGGVVDAGGAARPRRHGRPAAGAAAARGAVPEGHGP